MSPITLRAMFLLMGLAASAAASAQPARTAAEARAWVAARFAGEAAVSNCAALPKAAGG